MYQYDEVYNKVKEERKKAIAAKMAMNKKPKYIRSIKKAAEQRKIGYDRVIERKVKCIHVHVHVHHPVSCKRNCLVIYMVM